MFNWFRNFFAAPTGKPANGDQGTPALVPPPAGAAPKPWKRGTYAENMQPLKGGWNSSGTFCRYCGDWIVDSAFYDEHKGWHRPLRGSWNYENPRNTRRDPDGIRPGHEEWLEEMRAWAAKQASPESGCYCFSSTCGGINRHVPDAFHSEEEARSVLEPYGIAMTYSPKAIGSKGQYDADWTWHGGWSLHSVRGKFVGANGKKQAA